MYELFGGAPFPLAWRWLDHPLTTLDFLKSDDQALTIGPPLSYICKKPSQSCIPSFLFLRLFSQDILCPYLIFLILAYPTPLPSNLAFTKMQEGIKWEMRHFSKMSASHTHTQNQKSKTPSPQKNKEHEPSFSLTYFTLLSLFSYAQLLSIKP